MEPVDGSGATNHEAGERSKDGRFGRSRSVADAQRRASSYRGVPRVEIPAIGVSAPIVTLGLNPDRTLEVPKDYSAAGLWSGGASPGERGPAVLAGHVDSKTGPAVFHRLHELEAGDVVRFVPRTGSAVSFLAERVEERPKDRFPTAEVYGKSAGATLRLVTCSGPFDRAGDRYRDNLIVFARRAGGSARG